MNILRRRIYSTRQKTLSNCAFIRDFLGFQRCILSLMKAYDLREFFGGMSCYHDGEAMARALGVADPERFSNGFMEDSLDGSKADPVMLPSKIVQPNGEVEYCIGVRVWDLLLWFAMIGRPRLDVGILTDFSKTLAKLVYSLTFFVGLCYCIINNMLDFFFSVQVLNADFTTQHASLQHGAHDEAGSCGKEAGDNDLAWRGSAAG
jgi:hypothetical protein